MKSPSCAATRSGRWRPGTSTGVCPSPGGNGQAATAAIATDPVAAIRSVNALATPEGSALLVLPNFHRFLQSTEIVQALAHQIQRARTTARSS